MSAGLWFVFIDALVAITGFSLSIIALVIATQNRNVLLRNKRNGSGLLYARSRVVQEALSLAGHIFFMTFAISLIVNIDKVVIPTLDAGIRAYLIVVFTSLFTAKSAVALYAGRQVRGMKH